MEALVLSPRSTAPATMAVRSTVGPVVVKQEPGTSDPRKSATAAVKKLSQRVGKGTTKIAEPSDSSDTIVISDSEAVGRWSCSCCFRMCRAGFG